MLWAQSAPAINNIRRQVSRRQVGFAVPICPKFFFRDALRQNTLELSCGFMVLSPLSFLCMHSFLVVNRPHRDAGGFTEILQGCIFRNKQGCGASQKAKSE